MNLHDVAFALIQLPKEQRDRLIKALDGYIPPGFIGDKITEVAKSSEPQSIASAWLERIDLLQAFVQEPLPVTSKAVPPPVKSEPPPSVSKSSVAAKIEAAPSKKFGKKGEDDGT